MGMGLGTLALGSGAADYLQGLLKQRLLERQMALQERNAAQNEAYRQQEFEYGKGRDVAADARAQQQFLLQLAALRGTQQNRDQVAADRVAENMGIGDRVAWNSPERQTVEAGGMGNLFKAVPMSPSEAMGRLNVGQPGQMGARPITAEYADPEYEYQGTGAQRVAQANQARADARLAQTDARMDRQADQFNQRMAHSDAVLAASLGAAGRTGWQVQNITLPDGTTKTVRVNANTGEAQDFDLGGIPTTSDMSNRAASMRRIRPVLSRIADLSEKINTGKGVAAKLAGGVAKAEAEANLNDNVSLYNALVSGFTPMVARSVGHTGVLTQQDVDSVRELFPKPGDSKSVRDGKIAQIEAILGGSMQAGSATTTTGSGQYAPGSVKF